MVSAIDAFAFQILVSLFSLLGVQDIPSTFNSEWIIQERWVETGDQTYRLKMTSSVLPQTCRDEPTGFVVFPQTYMGRMNIYVDGKIIYTNSMSSKWHITQLMSKPLYTCAIFNDAKVVELEIYAYMRFFASVSGYPQFKRTFPQQYVFYDEMFVIASVVALFLGIVGAILVTQFSTITDAWLYLVQQASFCLLVASHIPGRFVDVNLAVAHTVVVIAGFLGLLTLTLNTVEISHRKKATLFFIFFWPCVLPGILFYGFKDATHLLVFLLIIAALSATIFMIIYKFMHLKRNKDYFITSLYIVLLFVLVFDGAGSQIRRESYLHLSSIAFIATIIAFLRVLKGFNGQQKALITTSMRLDAELKTIDAVTGMYNDYREIIHDIKSPVMSLNFLLSDVDKNRSLISSISSRLNVILSRVEEEGKVSKISDWYSVEAMSLRVQQIFEEKTSVYEKLEFEQTHVENANLEIYYNPVDVQIIVEELVDNAIKYSDGKVRIIWSDIHDTMLSCRFLNKKVSDRNENQLGKIGLGIGLLNLSKKMKDMSGAAEIQSIGTTFSVELMFKKRMRL